MHSSHQQPSHSAAQSPRASSRARAIAVPAHADPSAGSIAPLIAGFAGYLVLLPLIAFGLCAVMWAM